MCLVEFAFIIIFFFFQQDIIGRDIINFIKNWMLWTENSELLILFLNISNMELDIC